MKHLTAQRDLALKVGLLLTTLGSGCMGAINDGTAPGSGGSATENPNAPGGNGGGVPGDPAGPPTPGTPVTPPAAEPGVAHIRRLTRAELANTLRDLLGGSGQPTDALLPDGRTKETFFSNFAQATTLLDVEKYDEMATAVSDAIRPRELAPCDSTNETDCVRDFLAGFGRRVYRRPLSTDEVNRLVGVFETKRATENYGSSIRLLLRVLLQTPKFLYHQYLGEPTDEPGVMRLTGYEVAERLSYFLLGTTPSDELLDAASAGELDTVEGMTAQVEAMLDDPRVEDTLVRFHQEWLALDAVESAQRDPDVYGALTDAVRAAASEETREFVRQVYRDDGGSLETLLSAPMTYVNQDLAPLYGLSAITGADLRRVDLDSNERSGLLTQIAFLTVNSNFAQSSPIFRGVSVRERVLCDDLQDPPPGEMVEEPEVDPNVPTRERFAAHRDNPRCVGCHQLIDLIGFGFEAYDAIGRFRTMDGGQPVDDSGEVVAGGDAAGPFVGAIELTQRLSTSDAVRDCYAEQWFQFATGRALGTFDEGTLGVIRQDFAAGNHTMRALIRSIATSEPFRVVTADAG